VIITGLALIAACVSIILNKFVRLSCILLAVLLLIFILSIHIPMLFDKANATMALIELFKDTSLLGVHCLLPELMVYKKNKSGYEKYIY